MVVRINKYYSHEIDKLKESYIKDDYSLKSKYVFIGLFIGTIFYDFMLIAGNISIITSLVYATPLMIGTFIEFRAMKNYDALELGLEKIQKLFYISFVRTLNLYLFLASAILMFGKDVFAIILRENKYIIDINIVLIAVVLLVFIFSIIMFFIGIKIERTQVIKNKKKKYVSTAILGISITIGILLFRNVSYNYLLVTSMVVETLLAIGIGNVYHKYKNFNKKVAENDLMIEYKL